MQREKLANLTISFLKIPKDGIDFSLVKDGVHFIGHAIKLRDNLVECKGKIQGKLPYLCDRCGEDFILSLDENIEVLASDGLISSSDDMLENTIEFFDGFIDFNEIFISELEAFKSDYFYCQKCNT